LVVRFASFTRDAIRERLEWFAAYKAYAIAFEQAHPEARRQQEVTAPAPKSPLVRAEFIQPMLRWTFQSPQLTVQVESTGGSVSD
jgi:hypothetical protein